MARITVNRGSAFQLTFTVNVIQAEAVVRMFSMQPVFEGIATEDTSDPNTSDPDTPISSRQMLTLQTSVVERPDAEGRFTVTFLTTRSTPCGLFRFRNASMEMLCHVKCDTSVVPQFRRFQADNFVVVGPFTLRIRPQQPGGAVSACAKLPGFVLR